MSTLEHKLMNTTETVFTAEFHSLDGNGLEKAKKYADRFRGWFDGVNATDNTAAHAHASNVATAIAIKQLGLEPILQIVCRDKNRLAQQADIMGASMFGVENFVALTGDDVSSVDISRMSVQVRDATFDRLFMNLFHKLFPQQADGDFDARRFGDQSYLTIYNYLSNDVN